MTVTKVERYLYYIPRVGGPVRNGMRRYKRHILPTLNGSETAADLIQMLPWASESLREHYRNDHLSRSDIQQWLNIICLTEYLLRERANGD